MDTATLSKAMGGALPTAAYEAKVAAVNAGLIAAGCTTVNRVAMWCAQVGTESLGLRYMEEIASGAAYEGRRDLGNTQPGDGRRFKGHGPIQITGRANHTAVSRWAYSKGYVPTPTFFVDNPSALGSDQYGFLGVAWYFNVARPRINAMADAGDVLGVTRAVNGGTNGLADRQRRYVAARALGAALLPTTGDDMSKEDIDTINAKLDTLAKNVGAVARDVAETKKLSTSIFNVAKEARVQIGVAVKTLTNDLAYKIGKTVNKASPRSVAANTRLDAYRTKILVSQVLAAVKALASGNKQALQSIDKAVADVGEKLDELGEVDTEIHSADHQDPETVARVETEQEAQATP